MLTSWSKGQYKKNSKRIEWRTPSFIFSLTVHSTSVLERTYILNLFPGVIMYKKTSFLITGSIVMAAVVTVTFYTVNGANAQLAHVPNMTKSMNMTLQITR